jgi:hypothetical protein
LCRFDSGGKDAGGGGRSHHHTIIHHGYGIIKSWRIVSRFLPAGGAYPLGLKPPAVKRYSLGEIGPAVAKSKQSKKYLAWFLLTKSLKLLNFS